MSEAGGVVPKSETHRYDRYTGQYVIRKPYYYRDDMIPYLLPHPLHYILFSQFAIYRFFIGGVWFNNQGIWTRMEDRRPDEFCNEHCEMEPCSMCRIESDAVDWERNQYE